MEQKNGKVLVVGAGVDSEGEAVQLGCLGCIRVPGEGNAHPYGAGGLAALMGFSGKQFLEYHAIPAVIGDDFRPTVDEGVEFLNGGQSPVVVAGLTAFAPLRFGLDEGELPVKQRSFLPHQAGVEIIDCAVAIVLVPHLHT